MTCPAHPSEDLFRERLCVCRLLLAFAGSQVEPFIAAALLDFLVSVVGELACWKLRGATCCCRSVLGAPRKMGRGFPWSVSQLPAETTAEGWYVTPRKLSFPHTAANQLAPLIFRPLPQQISQFAKKDSKVRLALLPGISVGVKNQTRNLRKPFHA